MPSYVHTATFVLMPKRKQAAGNGAYPFKSFTSRTNLSKYSRYIPKTFFSNPL